MPAHVPSVFISYSHADKAVAVALHAELEKQDIKAWIDERELRVGDSIIERVATAVADADFFLALVSPASIESEWCKKELHLAITGELGREGVTVMPVRIGEVTMPKTLKDVFYLDLDEGDTPSAAARLVRDLRSHMTERHEVAMPPPQSIPGRRDAHPSSSDMSAETSLETTEDEPIRIIGIVREGIGKPLNDGTQGSALYRVPLRLSREPSELWSQVFEHEWSNQLYTMLREAYISGDTIVFPATTMEEIERHHISQLRTVLDRVNRETQRIEEESRIRAQRARELEKQREQEHDASINRVMERLKFDA